MWPTINRRVTGLKLPAGTLSAMSLTPKVLVVYDEQDIAVLINQALKRSGDAQIEWFRN